MKVEEEEWTLWKTLEDFVAFEHELSTREAIKGDISFPRLPRQFWNMEGSGREGIWPLDTPEPPQQMRCSRDGKADILQVWLRALQVDESIRKTKEFQSFTRYRHRKTRKVCPMSSYTFARDYYKRE